MEVAAVLLLLWRFRLLVGVGALVAVAAALALGPSPLPPRGYASTRVLFDTTPSQLLTDASPSAQSLPWRAALGGMLLGSGADRRRMANEVGITADELDVSDVELTAPTVPTSLAAAAAKAANATSAPYALTVYTDGSAPIVSIAATGPARAAAAKLAQAAVHALETGLPASDTQELLGMSLEQVSPIDSVEIPGGHGRKKTAALAVVVFALWCAGVALVPTLIRATRTVRDAGAGY